MSLIRMLKVLTVVFLILPFQVMAQNSSFLEQMKQLVPQGSHLLPVEPGSHHGNLIEEAIVRILATPTGLSFCAASTNDYKTFKALFFISDDFAQKGFRLCSHRFSSKVIFKAFQKKYFLLMGQSSEVIIDGWTTPRNETVIFYPSEGIEKGRLLRTLAHELAVSLDRKEQIGFFGKVDFPRLGILPDQKSCNLLKIIRKAEVKHTLTALRAFRVEQQIASEAELSSDEGLNQLLQMSCRDQVESLLPFVQRLKAAIEAEDIVNQFMDLSDCLPDISSAGTSTELLENLVQTQLQFSDGKSRNACEYMTEGIPFYAGLSFRGGPGPRIGGGWKDSHARPDGVRRLELDEKIFTGIKKKEARPRIQENLPNSDQRKIELKIDKETRP